MLVGPIGKVGDCPRLSGCKSAGASSLDVVDEAMECVGVGPGGS